MHYKMKYSNIIAFDYMFMYINVFMFLSTFFDMLIILFFEFIQYARFLYIYIYIYILLFHSNYMYHH